MKLFFISLLVLGTIPASAKKGYWYHKETCNGGAQGYSNIDEKKSYRYVTGPGHGEWVMYVSLNCSEPGSTGCNFSDGGPIIMTYPDVELQVTSQLANNVLTGHKYADGTSGTCTIDDLDNISFEQSSYLWQQAGSVLSIDIFDVVDL
jgi:hypothetical protein